MKKVMAFLALVLPLASALSARAQEIHTAGQPTIVQDQSKLPHVVIVSMGGTIASRAKDRMNLTHYGDGPAVEPEDWLHDLPELQNVARVTTEDLKNKEKGKGDNFGDIARVAHRLNEMAKDPSIDGIV